MIETANLTLVPYDPDDLLALFESARRFEERFGMPPAAGLREFMTSEEVSPAWLEHLRAASGPDPWSFGFAVVHREAREVIGSVAYKGRPDAEGVVEIAYGIVPVYQGRGYATEAASALVAYARDEGGARLVIAHTRPVPGPSPRVLEKCGFSRAGDVIDPEDGPVWRWECACPATS